MSSLSNLNVISQCEQQDRIVMGAERRSAFISEKDKLSTAYHEVSAFFLVYDSTEYLNTGWTYTGRALYRRGNAAA